MPEDGKKATNYTLSKEKALKDLSMCKKACVTGGIFC